MARRFIPFGASYYTLQEMELIERCTSEHLREIPIEYRGYTDANIVKLYGEPLPPTPYRSKIHGIDFKLYSDYCREYGIKKTKLPDGTKQIAIEHFGQFKLAGCEMKAILEAIKISEKTGKPILLVMVGSSPGTHILFLNHLFSRYNIEYHLFDPANIDPRVLEIKNTTYTQGCFTDEHAAYYATIKDKLVLFISDIRTGNIELTDFEDYVKGDMEMQERWVLTIRPAVTLLKFRLPYILNEEDKAPYTYLDGTLLVQPFAGISSTELRLLILPEHEFRRIEYSPQEVEDNMFRFNILKNYASFDNIYHSCNCVNCSIFCKILAEVLQYQDVCLVSRTGIYFEQASTIIGQKLRRLVHGRLNSVFGGAGGEMMRCVVANAGTMSGILQKKLVEREKTHHLPLSGKPKPN